MIPGFFFSSGRVPAVKEKGDGLRKAQSGFFPTSRRAGPLPFFTWRSPRHHHFAVHYFDFLAHSVFAFLFRSSLFVRSSVLRFAFSGQPYPSSLSPCLTHFLRVQGYFPIFSYYYAIVFFYISLYFLLSPIPIESNIGLVFSSFFFLPLSFHTFKPML